MNITPQAIRPLEVSASRALLGVKELGATIGLKANDDTILAPAIYDLFGRPEDPTATPPVVAIDGKQALYTQAKAQHAVARAALRDAVANGYEFAALAVRTLTGELGRKWNSQWAAVGFTSGSLRLPKNPLPVLTALGSYYRTHAAHEVASLNLTAAKADLLKSASLTAENAAAAAHEAEGTAKQARDVAFDKVRMRIAALREELDTLLTPEDMRWYRFGFRRPVDGSTPDLVPEVRLSPGVAGQVTVEWGRARLAENYRVSWRLASAPPETEPTQVGLFSDRLALITGLTSGVAITVIVTARNASGESAPTEANIVVP